MFILSGKTMYNTDHITTIGLDEFDECIYIVEAGNKNGSGTSIIYNGENPPEIFLQIQIALASGKNFYKIPNE